MRIHDSDGLRTPRIPQRYDEGGDFTQQRACLKSRKILNPCLDGTCKTIYARIGRLSWENYLGRLEHGGWDTQMTCILGVWTKG